MVKGRKKQQRAAAKREKKAATKEAQDGQKAEQVQPLKAAPRAPAGQRNAQGGASRGQLAGKVTKKKKVNRRNKSFKLRKRLEQQGAAPAAQSAHPGGQPAKKKERKERKEKKERPPKAKEDFPPEELLRRRGDGVVYIGHIPHGFYEDELKGYLSQYGKVKRLRLSRNPKTGKSRGYAFVQFVDKEVAAEVASEIHGVLLGQRVLQCEVVEPENVHEQLWKGVGKYSRRMRKLDDDIRTSGRMKHYHKPVQQANLLKKLRHYVFSERKANAALKKAGFDYEFTGFQKRKEELHEKGILKQLADARKRDGVAKQRKPKSPGKAKAASPAAAPAPAAAAAPAAAGAAGAGSPQKKATSAKEAVRAAAQAKALKGKRTGADAAGSGAAKKRKAQAGA